MSGLSEILRFHLLVFTLSAVALALGCRLVFLHGDLVASKPEQPNYSFTRDTQGLRGAIYPSNRNSAPFARSVPVWVYHVDPTAVTLKKHSRQDVARTVAAALQMPYDKVWDAYCRVDSRYVYLTMSSDTDANKVLSDPKKVSGLRADEIQIRRYPQGRRLSHVLGYVSKDPTNSIGSAGIEMRYERYLRGIPGKIEGEVDARRREIYNRRVVSTDPRPGCDVYLTIDQNLQYEVETALAKGVAKSRAQAGWAIVLQVKTGAVLAMASLPDYEPETYNRSNAEAKKNLASLRTFSLFKGRLANFSSNFSHSSLGYTNKQPSNPLVTTDSSPNLSLNFAGTMTRPLASIVWLYSPLNIRRSLHTRKG